MSPSDRSAALGRTGVRRLGVLIGAGVAVLAALLAAVPALISLEWGSDSGPVTVVAAGPPAVVSAGLLRWLMTVGPRVSRTPAAVAIGVVGLAVWAVALTAAFRTESAYSSTVDGAGTATVWIIIGGLGALGAVASSALLPRRARTVGWATGVLLVVLLWGVFGIIRFLDS